MGGGPSFDKTPNKDTFPRTMGKASLADAFCLQKGSFSSMFGGSKKKKTIHILDGSSLLHFTRPPGSMKPDVDLMR